MTRQNFLIRTLVLYISGKIFFFPLASNKENGYKISY